MRHLFSLFLQSRDLVGLKSTDERYSFAGCARAVVRELVDQGWTNGTLLRLPELDRLIAERAVNNELYMTIWSVRGPAHSHDGQLPEVNAEVRCAEFVAVEH